MKTLDDVNLGVYDFIDFGAGKGGSVQFCTQQFGGQGLGIDNNPSKVEAAQEAGVDVVYGDITALLRQPTVRYVSMCDFLEHLPSYGLVREMLSVAAAVATDFIFIKHPSFEDEAYLRALGLKQYWQDWTGHPSHLLLPELVEMFHKVGAMPISIYYIDPIYSSSDPTILPIDAPTDQHRYDPGMHPPKPLVEFDRPVHRQLQITAYLRSPAFRA